MVEELVNHPMEGIPGPLSVLVPYNPEPIIMGPDCHGKFMKLNPPTFAGTKNFIEAKGWLKAVEKAFRVLGATSEQKVLPATYLLVGKVDWWWEFRHTTLAVPITWERFLGAFAEYFPARLRHQKLAFMQLTQGNQSVVAYAWRFTELTHFALAMLTDEGQRARKFQWGLRLKILDSLVVLELNTYDEILAKAEIVQSRLRGLSSGVGSSRPPMPPRRLTPRFGSQDKRPRMVTEISPRPSSTPGKAPTCRTCGKNHGNQPCNHIT
ncbi:uncharacterized protein LOC110812004 [Carica papaya]|uniref:uncharacterized protein LOC110812004 n=1 Tax=Carica papaya TaxID=3649 RepID=UPI000B8CAD46|nr:uncharacterized protein LOC110812004 [Carica papaya]